MKRQIHVPSLKDVHIIQNALSNNKSIDFFLQQFNSEINYEELLTHSKSSYCLLPIEKYYTCLTCSEGKIKYCSHCFDFEFHKGHLIKEVNKIALCQCGMNYKGEIKGCCRHIGEEFNMKEGVSIELTQELNEYIEVFCNKLLFRIVNLKYQILVKEISKLFAIHSIFNLIGDVIFKEGRCLLSPLFERKNKLSQNDYLFLSYYLLLPLLYHPLSSPLLQLVNKHCDQFKNLLFEYYSTIPFDAVLDGKLRCNKRLFLKTLYNALTIVVDPNIQNLLNTSHKVAIRRCSNVLAEISRDFDWFFEETDIFIRILLTLLSIYNIKQSIRSCIFLDFITFFQQCLRRLPLPLLTTFLDKISILPKGAFDILLIAIYSKGDDKMITKYANLFKNTLVFDYPSIDVVIPFRVTFAKKEVLDPFVVQTNKYNDGAEPYINEIKLMIEFHALFQELNQLESNQFYNKIKEMNFDGKEIVFLVWLFNYNPDCFCKYVFQLHQLLKSVGETSLNISVLIVSLHELFQKYYYQPFFCNPFIPFAPGICLPFTVFLRDQLKLPLDRFGCLIQRKDLLENTQLTYLMSISHHYHFIINLLWKRIDCFISITNDPYISSLVIHLLNYISNNLSFKESILKILVEYENVTPGVQLIVFKNKSILNQM